MLTRIEKAQQQWGGSNTLIDTWLGKRQELIVNYCQIAGLPPFESQGQALPATNAIQDFCNKLVDYVSTGHFEIYKELVSCCETHGQTSLDQINNIIPQISDTTDMSLEFSDKYAENQDASLDLFDRHLSTLIEGLEHRFELEDQLLSTLYEKHSKPA
jgi:regulator of sigma D